jgi:hypothetical protein
MRTLICAAVVSMLSLAASAAAQDSNFALQQQESPALVTGWLFTPSMLYQTAWDDNVLLRGRGDEAPRDYLNILNPRGDLHYTGRRGEMDLNYDGAFLFYRELSALNSYDQHGNFEARRRLSPHLSLFVRDSAAIVPTTELLQFIAVPFIRTGSKLNLLRGGMEAALSKYTSFTVSYEYQWVRFDSDLLNNVFLRGGHSNGGDFALRHAITERSTIIADYSIRHALVADGGTFDVQNGDVGLERRLSEQTRVFAAAGVSYLGVSDRGPARTGPSIRAGLSHHYQRAIVDLVYSRSYVPAFGFGGTYQNEEIGAHLQLPLTRRLYLQTSTSYRQNEPLTEGDVRLKSVWVEGVLGYALQPWLRLEGFYSGSYQDTSRAGGQIGRNRLGIQVSTTKPMRVR